MFRHLACFVLPKSLKLPFKPTCVYSDRTVSRSLGVIFAKPTQRSKFSTHQLRTWCIRGMTQFCSGALFSWRVFLRCRWDGRFSSHLHYSPTGAEALLKTKIEPTHQTRAKLLLWHIPGFMRTVALVEWSYYFGEKFNSLKVIPHDAWSESVKRHIGHSRSVKVYCV